MVEVVQLQGEARAGAGRGASRALRREGKVPAVVYGAGKDNELVIVDRRTLAREYQRGGFANRLVDLSVGGETQRVLPREIQFDPVSDAPLHVDFLRLAPGSEVRLMVPVTFLDEELSPGIKRGGLVNIVRHDVELICRADSIPEHLTASLDGLDIGDSVHISNITLPENVRPVITDRDFTVATVAAPTVIVEEEVEKAEAEEGEEAAADEAAEGQGEGEGEGEGDAKKDERGKD